jgi:hypothetical protein
MNRWAFVWLYETLGTAEFVDFLLSIPPGSLDRVSQSSFMHVVGFYIN